MIILRFSCQQQLHNLTYLQQLLSLGSNIGHKLEKGSFHLHRDLTHLPAAVPCHLPEQHWHVAACATRLYAQHLLLLCCVSGL